MLDVNLNLANSTVKEKADSIQEIVGNINDTLRDINAKEEMFEKSIRLLEEELKRLECLSESRLVSLPLRKIWKEFDYHIEEELWSVKNADDAAIALQREEHWVKEVRKMISNYSKIQTLVLEVTEMILPKLQEEGIKEEKLLRHATAIYRVGRGVLKNRFGIDLSEPNWTTRRIVADYLEKLEYHVNALKAQTKEEGTELGEEKKDAYRELNNMVGEIALRQKYTRDALPKVKACLEALATEVSYFKNVLPNRGKGAQHNWTPEEFSEPEYYFPESYLKPVSVEEEQRLRNKLSKELTRLKNYNAIINVLFLEMDSIHCLVNREILPALKMLWAYYEESLGCSSSISSDAELEEAVKQAKKLPWQENSNTVLESRHLLLIQNTWNYVNAAYKTLDKLISILNRPLKELEFNSRKEALDVIYQLDKIRTELRLYIPHQKVEQQEKKRLKDISFFQWDKLMKYW